MLTTTTARRTPGRAHRTLQQARSYHFHLHPFCSSAYPREKLLLLLRLAAARRAVVLRWEYAAGRWARVEAKRVEEYDIDLITLRKVPRQAEARAETGAGSDKEKKEMEKAERERERAEKEKKDREKAEKEKREKEKAEREKKERERAEKEKKDREKAEKEKREKEKAEKEKKERERAEKEKEKKEKEKKEKKEKEKKEKEEKEKKEKEVKETKEKEEKEKAKEKLEKEKGKEPKASPKDNGPIDLPVKTTKATTSEILAKIIKGQTQELQKMAPPELPEKSTGRKEVATPEVEATAKVAKPKSQPTSAVAQNTEVNNLKEVAKETPLSSPTSIKTDDITTPPKTGTIPATAVPKNEQATATPKVEKDSLKSHKLSPGEESKEAQDSPDADIDLLLPSDVRTAAGIPVKAQAKTEAKTEPKGEKAKQPARADTNLPPSQKPRESLEEQRKRMRRIADSLDLGPIESFIPAKDHHHEHDYEWSGTENVSTEDVLNPTSAATAPAIEPTPKPMPPTPGPTPLIEPVVPTMPFNEPPTLPPQAPAPTPTPAAATLPSSTPQNYYILVRNPDSGSMHFTPLPNSLISDFPTLSRESTAFDAMRRLTSPEAFLPLWRVLQRGGFEVVGGERDCLVVKVDRLGSRIKVGEVVKELKGMLSPAARVAKEGWERRKERERERVVAQEEAVQPEVQEVVKEVGSRPGRKIFWSAVWVAACTGAVTVGLETYL